MSCGAARADDHSAARLRDLAQPASALFRGPGTWLPGADAVLLSEPEGVLTADRADQVPALLEALEKETRHGRTVALALSYEAGAAFGLETHTPDPGFPVAWAGIYAPRSVHILGRDALLPPSTPPDVAATALHSQLRAEEHAAGIAAIKAYIAAGDTYQVNYTFRVNFEVQGDPLAYFLALQDSHPVPYAAYLNLGEIQVLSLSPELFLRRRGPAVESRPMKGTRQRGRTLEEDRAVTHELSSSLKDRAENLMIVDMVRNDLGRVSVSGGVAVPALFTLERYRTVWQMTSTVTGTLRPGTGLGEILAATFPGASVTGAPKVRTMQIIRELEAGPRGLYTGAIALLTPNGDFTMNLPIRTLVHRQGHYELGIGAGVVWDSDAEAEYAESLLKARFALRPTAGLALYETIRHTPGVGCAFMEEHLQRLAHSAEYWGFPLSPPRARQRLQAAVAQHHDASCVLRLELHSSGDLHVTSRPVPAPPAGPVSVLLSAQHTDAADRFLAHKTNHRLVYDRERVAALEEGFFEVIFSNTSGQLTEGAITNLFVKLGGSWYTPPISDGLLPGIWRGRFMADAGATERSISAAELAGAEAMVVGNSVRGIIPVAEVRDSSGEVVANFA
jgi:para-aminobenzoate synthetase / 4-amino-4-deoxychorismate lyase